MNTLLLMDCSEKATTWPDAFLAVGCAFAAALGIWAYVWGMPR